MNPRELSNVIRMCRKRDYSYMEEEIIHSQQLNKNNKI